MESNVDNLQSDEAKNSRVTWKESRNGYSVPCIFGKAQASLYDPLREAKRQIEALTNELSAQPDLKRVLIVGSTGPLFLHELIKSNLLRSYGWAVIEPEAEIREAVLNSLEHGFNSSLLPGNSKTRENDHHKDVSHRREESQESETLNKIAVESLSHLLLTEEEANRFLELPCLLYPLRGAMQSHADYQELFHRLNNRAQRRQINRNTLDRFGALWMRNLYGNALSFRESRSLNELKDLHIGRPVVILGAGPSLAQHLPELAQLQTQDNPPVMIAVDTALSVCHLHGLHPHYALTVDPQPINFYHLAGESSSENRQQNHPRDAEPETRRHQRPETTLIADPSCSPLALRRWTGPMVSTGNPFPMAEKLFQFWNRDLPAQLSYGGSVSTNAYDLAFYLGCKEILLVGQDLGFSHTRVHARGAALEELWSFRESRLHSRETANYRQRFAIPVVPLSSEDGKWVHSNDKLQVFHQWFSHRFESDQHRARISLLASDGASFKNATLFHSAWDWWNSLGMVSHPTDESVPEISNSEDSFPERDNADDDMVVRDVTFKNIQMFLDQVESLGDIVHDSFLSRWQEYASCLRIVGAPLQKEIEALLKEESVSPEFLSGIQQELTKHKVLLRKLLARIGA